MAYLVIAYPNISSEDFSWIQKYREQNDALYFNVVKPHFTIVFPTFDVKVDDFVNEITNLASGLKRFDFKARCFVVNKDAFNDYYHEFLVPDEGFSNFIKLRDHFYSGKLSKNLRFDIDFIPHVGIGNSQNPQECKDRVDALNKKNLEIVGTIDKLAILKYEDDTITEIKNVELN
tara:strand:+ start:587 stop:1111 length:525 start_codon:yes stop_codon:yes gene_type:complete